MTTPTPATQTASELASQHHAAQAALATALSQQVQAAWTALLDVNQLKKTIPHLSAGVAALVQQYGSASAGVAADYYDAARAAAAARGSYTVVPATPAGPDQTAANVRWATKNLWTPDPDVRPAQVLTQGLAERLALDAGRSTLTGAVQGDRQAQGWARHTEPGACSFCLLLSTRGPAYNSKQTAGFEAHDHDHCQPEPVFGIWEPSADTRHWQSVYKQAAKAGSGKTVRDEFRRLVAAHRDSQGPAQGDDTPHGG
ncbi:MAG TPA: hypothetical protein VHX15_15745 [Frankiaceae bacterium]|jgi:hypothetical protein|nr:hypothetical protein [Frankiaceae bacterium]